MILASKIYIAIFINVVFYCYKILQPIGGI